MDTRQIKIQLSDGTQQKVLLTFYNEQMDLYVLKTDYVPLSRKRYQERDYFECLKMLRLDGEKLGIKLLCNGARTDAYPSGMSRDMGGGLMVHIQAMGKKDRLRELVFIFDEAPAETIGTVAEQWQFRQEWLNEGQPGREGPACHIITSDNTEWINEGQPGWESGIDNTNVETITWREENGYQPE